MSVAGVGQKESDRTILERESSLATEAVERALSAARERLGPFIKNWVIEGANTASVPKPRPNVAPAYEAVFANATTVKEAAAQIKELIESAEL